MAELPFPPSPPAHGDAVSSAISGDLQHASFCPKRGVSWMKQHSAPTAGIGFSPSNDKIIASVGLDKKLYTYDSGSRRPTSCISCEAPFSCLAFRDDGWMLAAGTSNGRVAFYDVRGKPQPFGVLHAYGSSE
ncbi:protein NEDD1-like, partial [Trifolium pratense]